MSRKTREQSIHRLSFLGRAPGVHGNSPELVIYTCKSVDKHEWVLGGRRGGRMRTVEVSSPAERWIYPFVLHWDKCLDVTATSGGCAARALNESETRSSSRSGLRLARRCLSGWIQCNCQSPPRSMLITVQTRIFMRGRGDSCEARPQPSILMSHRLQKKT